MLLGSLSLSTPIPAATPVLWGYGVRSCGDYLAAVKAEAEGDATELQRYEDWLTGFISGLNLSLGQDVLSGSGLTSAMARTQAACEKNPRQDFFNATIELVRTLEELR